MYTVSPSPVGKDADDAAADADEEPGGAPAVRNPATDGEPPAARRGRLRGVGPTVVLLGLTSLLTDLSTEMVTAVLPLYLVERLGFTPFQYGLANGLYQGASAVSRLVSGFVSDRFHRHRDVAATGYAMSAAAKVVLAAGGVSPGTLSGALAADQIGKGLRTAPRDAMLSLSAPASRLGFAFGLHRAMDTVGAMLGPFVAFALLAVSPGSYDLVFVLSACIGLVGVAVIVLLVRPPSAHPARPGSAGPGSAGPGAGRPPSAGATFGLLRAPGYRRLACVGVGLALCTIGDGFVYLRLEQRLDFAMAYFPLLAAGVYCVYLVLALPLGLLADAVGRGRVFVGGYLALSGVYLVLCFAQPGMLGLIAVLVMMGAYYAATDGVLAAAASALVPAELRTGGLALVQTGVALAQLAGSVAFGALWTWRGPDVAFRWAVLAGLIAIVLAVVALRGAGGGRRTAGPARVRTG
ncbi:MFS transporter [Frankia sp. R43]|uniref:MFS transporter n=1 Tax=Frankia sp. R43 TaxID=269536 RepID=UPI000A991378|nr:MFS transporter [Frankia sp. R43]